MVFMKIPKIKHNVVRSKYVVVEHATYTSIR